jgi:hypothetical protein
MKKLVQLFSNSEPFYFYHMYLTKQFSETEHFFNRFAFKMQFLNLMFRSVQIHKACYCATQFRSQILMKFNAF